MNEGKKKPGDIIHALELLEILKSVGITVACVATDIVGTDNIYGEAWQLDTAAQLSALSELMAHVCKRYSSVLTGIEIDLPDDMIGMVTVNPLREHSMSKSSHDGEDDDMTTVGEIPF